jgi:predicted DNA-binding helix-hairpin-helix protein
MAPPLVREHRLYQADWLMRFYGFRAEELTTESEPNLALKHDPKVGWAMRHPEAFPVDLNRAPRESMLRVPGLGVRNVDRLLHVRRWKRVIFSDLVRLKIPVQKTRPFIVVADYRPTTIGGASWRSLAQPERQLELFDEMKPASIQPRAGA